VKSCREIRAGIAASLDESLPIEAVFAIEEHVRGCEACRAEHELARELEAALARIPEPPVDRLDVERAVATVRAAIDPGRTPVARRRWIPIAVAAACAASLLLTLRLPLPHPHPARPSVPAPALVEEPRILPEPPPDPRNAARAQQARDEVRCVLARAAASPPQDLASVFDEGARDLDRAGWPVLRLVEGALGDPELPVARAAARVLGARADRLAIRALESAFARPELRVDAALALCDAGDLGVESLEPALQDPRTRPLVLERLVARRGEPTVRVIETFVRDAGRLAPAPDRSALVLEGIDSLARLGPDAVVPLLRLGSSGAIAPAEAIDALARTEGAGDAVADLVLARPRAVDDALALQAVAALAPPRALPLLERRALESREHRREVVDAIAACGGEGGLAALLRLLASGKIAESELEEPIAACLSRARDAGAGVVQAFTRAGRRVELQVSHAFLVGHAGAACAPAFVALGGCAMLPASDRRWAVLLAGEVGRASDAEAVAELYASLKPAERELRAACLVAIRELAGLERVERALEGLPPRALRRALSLLADADAKSRPVSTVAHLARELESALAPGAP